MGKALPCVGGVAAELQAKDGLELGDFLVGEQFGIVHAEMRVIVGVHVGSAVLEGRLLDLGGGAADAGEGHPVVIALVEVLEVDVVGVGVFILGFGGIIIYNNISAEEKGNPSGLHGRKAYPCSTCSPRS